MERENVVRADLCAAAISVTRAAADCHTQHPTDDIFLDRLGRMTLPNSSTWPCVPAKLRSWSDIGPMHPVMKMTA